MVNIEAASRSWIVAAKRFEDVLLRQIETPLLHLDRSIRQLRVGPQQPAKVGTADAQFGRRLADIDRPLREVRSR
jgi:hypothetical protein